MGRPAFPLLISKCHLHFILDYALADPHFLCRAVGLPRKESQRIKSPLLGPVPDFMLTVACSGVHVGRQSLDLGLFVGTGRRGRVF